MKKHQIDLSKFQLRTDLAIETIDNNLKKEIIEDDIKITYFNIDEKLGKKINKKKGNYYTLEFNDITDFNYREDVKKIFSKYLKKLLELNNIDKDKSCLIIGLGNEKSTPDSLGPKTIENILVTNHLFLYGNVEEGFRRVSAIIPGVMGQTGIETSDIINSICNNIDVDFIIVIDALASQSVDRLNRTIQMTDTGIHPGSGIGNGRKEISFDILKKQVIAIGVPTVVDASTIVTDTINYLYKHYFYNKKNINKPSNKFTFGNINYLKKDINIDLESKKELFGIIGNLDDLELKQLFYEVLTPIGYNLMVTPKEVDFQIDLLSKVIGNGINEKKKKKVN